MWEMCACSKSALNYEQRAHPRVVCAACGLTVDSCHYTGAGGGTGHGGAPGGAPGQATRRTRNTGARPPGAAVCAACLFSGGAGRLRAASGSGPGTAYMGLALGGSPALGPGRAAGRPPGAPAPAPKSTDNRHLLTDTDRVRRHSRLGLGLGGRRERERGRGVLGSFSGM